MSNHDRLIELGWEHLGGAALAKASEILGYDLGPAAYAKKFGRKTVFLRDTGIFKLSVPMDRDDPARAEASTGSKVYMRHLYLESIDDAARHLVNQFHDESIDS